jgi:hypothetical protein
MHLFGIHRKVSSLFCGLVTHRAEADLTYTEESSCDPPAKVQHTDQASKILELTLRRVIHHLLPDSAPSQDGGGLQVYSAKSPSEC